VVANPLQLAQAIRQLANNVEQRLIQARALREHLIQEKGPVIIAGDLNSPVASTVCSILNDAGYKDSFSMAGRGYGYTYGHFLLERKVPFWNFSWMRIDHIMTTPHFSSQRCWTGTSKASDHRPVIADLALVLE
jgi:endonuclease/exonuclease/phosphatase family metal-dependent hydrolase